MRSNAVMRRLLHLLYTVVAMSAAVHVRRHNDGSKIEHDHQLECIGHCGDIFYKVVKEKGALHHAADKRIEYLELFCDAHRNATSCADVCRSRHKVHCDGCEDMFARKFVRTMDYPCETANYEALMLRRKCLQGALFNEYTCHNQCVREVAKRRLKSMSHKCEIATCMSKCAEPTILEHCNNDHIAVNLYRNWREDISIKTDPGLRRAYDDPNLNVNDLPHECRSFFNSKGQFPKARSDSTRGMLNETGGSRIVSLAFTLLLLTFCSILLL